MTDEDKKRISEYMRWNIVMVGPQKSPYPIYVDNINPNIHHRFDLNDAALCVQEIQKRGSIFEFYMHLIDVYNGLIEDGKEICGADNFTVWLFNADNFFNAMSEWLEEKGK